MSMNILLDIFDVISQVISKVKQTGNMRVETVFSDFVFEIVQTLLVNSVVLVAILENSKTSLSVTT